MSIIVVYCTVCYQKLIRRPSAVNSNGHNFCNHHCAATYTNSKRVTKLSAQKQYRIMQSPLCKKEGCLNRVGLENIIFCSKECKRAAYLDGGKEFMVETINRVKKFCEQNGRLPMKCEFSKGYKRIRFVFGTWNKMIVSAGYEPNPVLFSKHFIANDGHKCDSLSEKIVDDWLFSRKIPHKVKVKYPWNNGMTADFKVGEYWIEFFGLCGQLKGYDNLMKIKLQKVKEYNLNLISLFISDLFPKNRLSDKLDHLRKSITSL